MKCADEVSFGKSVKQEENLEPWRGTSPQKVVDGVEEQNISFIKQNLLKTKMAPESTGVAKENWGEKSASNENKHKT